MSHDRSNSISNIELSLSSETQQQLAEILDEYLRSMEEGIPADPEQLVARYPDLAEPLSEYIDGLSLLHEVGGDFQQASKCASDDQCPQSHGYRGRQLGDFQLIREIGRGGMGVVYEARQLSLDRQVALKVLPFAAVLDRKQILRFQNEARAAAQLHHPHIVPIHGVGSDRGVHFYAMQFIEGKSIREMIDELRVQESPTAPSAVASDVAPIAAPSSEQSTSKSDDTRPLPSSRTWPQQNDRIRAVVRIGSQAAEALQAAHEAGVVHRDIKPSNLLIDDVGKLWITDFGLARSQANANLSRSGDILGTLYYMSPEQARGDSALVDQRTDVYSLGVTLYELLTLHRAFDGHDNVNVLRNIDRGACSKVRAQNPAVPADLENVIAKAMSVSRDDRYQTAQAMAEDLNRFLMGKPTHAKPPSSMQRILKWGVRHRRTVVAASIILGILLCGLVSGLVVLSGKKLQIEAQNAALSGSLARQRTIIKSLQQHAQRLSRIPAARRQLKPMWNEVLREYQWFLAHHVTSRQAETRSEVALTYAKIGGIHKQCDEHAKALGAYRNAEASLRRLLADYPEDEEHAVRLSRCLNHIGLILREMGSKDHSLGPIDEAISIQSRLLQTSPRRIELLADLGSSWNNKALVLSDMVDDQEESTAAYRKAAAQLEQVRLRRPDDHASRQTLATIYSNLAMLISDHDPMGGEDFFSQSLEIREELLQASPDDFTGQMELAATFNGLASVRARQNGADVAIELCKKAIRIQQAVVEEWNLPEYQRDLAISWNNLGRAYGLLNDLPKAEASFREALKLQGKLVSRHNEKLAYANELGGTYNNLGVVLRQAGRLAEASQAYGQAISYQEPAYRKAKHVSQFRDFLNSSYLNQAQALRELGQHAEALVTTQKRRGLWQDADVTLVKGS